MLRERDCQQYAPRHNQQMRGGELIRCLRGGVNFGVQYRTVPVPYGTVPYRTRVLHCCAFAYGTRIVPYRTVPYGAVRYLYDTGTGPYGTGKDYSSKQQTPRVQVSKSSRQAYAVPKTGTVPVRDRTIV